MPTAPGPFGAARWCRDLAMGARFAVTGGHPGWIRTTLTALGVGLGVAVLLFAAAVPNVMNASLGRDRARGTVPAAAGTGPGDHTLLITSVSTTYHGADVGGRALQAEGPHAPVPPGLRRLPRPGEMAVSPALAELLSSPDGALLKDRFPHRRITARIGATGLAHPGELRFYEGTDALRGPSENVERITGFGEWGTPFESGPLVVLAIVVGCVALLAPVAVFIATAVRFGGDRRDRRLAALRLVGADRATTRRVAAGEALAGALLGLLTGTVLFLAVRVPLSDVTVAGIGVFPTDVVPGAPLAAFIAVAVPLCAVAVTLATMRRVTVEPLGVTRTAPPPRRRLWWRLLLPCAGVALLLPQAIGGLRPGDAAMTQLILGTSFLLLGVAALLPWALDAAVARLGRSGRGGQSWQLAVRRLQLTGAAAVRSVSGITVAVAGAIAVQLLLTGAGGVEPPAETDPYTRWTEVDARDGALPAARTHEFHDRLAAADGVRPGPVLTVAYAGPAGLPHGAGAEAADDPEPYPLTLADCAALRRLARIGSCADGDVFRTEDPDAEAPRPGQRLALEPATARADHRRPATWTVPSGARRVEARDALPPWLPFPRLLVTPGALDGDLLRHHSVMVLVRLDPHRPDAIEHLRNAAAHVDPRIAVLSYGTSGDDGVLDITRRALTAGAVAVLLLIGCGLLITTLEQLHERSRLLSALHALGTPRAVLGRSILWQTALPVAVGLGLAVACGLPLGLLFLHMVGRPPEPEWWDILTLTGTAGTVILGVTALSLPLLWRLMRPAGLRTE
ncbi:FtsX-like permease family protein [Streptomyces sp. NPDC048638]|uniref:FtsX-like permease family protein n=1 Tax=Streptomyces sp. NPDC048638 TaxID=3365580 RepID=UPI0037159EAD